MLASPSSEGIVATGFTTTAERMALPESSAESALGETALTGSDPVERPIATARPILVHALTGSDHPAAQPNGLATTVFAGVVSEDTSAASDRAGAGLVGLSMLEAACSDSSMRNDANVAHAHAFMLPHVNNLADVALSAHGILGCAFFPVRFPDSNFRRPLHCPPLLCIHAHIGRTRYQRRVDRPVLESTEANMPLTPLLKAVTARTAPDLSSFPSSGAGALSKLAVPSSYQPL